MLWIVTWVQLHFTVMLMSLTRSHVFWHAIPWNSLGNDCLRAKSLPKNTKIVFEPVALDSTLDQAMSSTGPVHTPNLPSTDGLLSNVNGPFGFVQLLLMNLANILGTNRTFFA